MAHTTSELERYILRGFIELIDAYAATVAAKE